MSASHDALIHHKLATPLQLPLCGGSSKSNGVQHRVPSPTPCHPTPTNASYQAVPNHAAAKDYGHPSPCHTPTIENRVIHFSHPRQSLRCLPLPPATLQPSSIVTQCGNGVNICGSAAVGGRAGNLFSVFLLHHMQKHVQAHTSIPLKRGHGQPSQVIIPQCAIKNDKRRKASRTRKEPKP